MRLFVAIGLPDGVTEALENLATALPVGRAMAADAMHLTLAFAGEQPGDVAEDIAHSLDTMRHPAIALHLKGLDTLGGREPHVLAIMAERAPALMALQAQVATRLRAAGVDLERRRFRPHVTLARFNRRLAAEEAVKLGRFLEAHGDAALPAFEAASFALYRSDLGKAGAIHTELMRYDLG
ncbi:RNA 2',3'-cyclic phosphodiesterase [Halovulum dunhuangense]|uniref:RNA 2',3'-cyclic phosphodiesterase n=1 Tax=Halovulum dunhuangense TaxID=1505036 RepID=A0A849KVB0_9RHOB|nr:RNA 2',3'-cyclic phosphodiesterase [Halovulum dunhuangense]NNU79591.1 RNA 2',3'-cyclic phosphodiesterase [Halovulum dunhuangense]